MRVGIAADHGGLTLKEQLAESLRVLDFGAHCLNPGDDYPDFVIPLAKAIAAGETSADSRSAATDRSCGINPRSAAGNLHAGQPRIRIFKRLQIE